MSGHLGTLLDAGLVRVEAAGRYRHYQIASRTIADLLEQIDSIDLPETTPPSRPKTGHGLAYARSCYDHIAGQLGVDLHDACIEHGWVAVDGERPQLTATGAELFADLGLDIEHLHTLRRPMLRLDLDWTERRHHLAGSLPAALLDHLMAQRWITRRADKRQLTITEQGRKKASARRSSSRSDRAKRRRTRRAFIPSFYRYPRFHRTGASRPEA